MIIQILECVRQKNNEQTAKMLCSIGFKIKFITAVLHTKIVL